MEKYESRCETREFYATNTGRRSDWEIFKKDTDEFVGELSFNEPITVRLANGRRFDHDSIHGILYYIEDNQWPGHQADWRDGWEEAREDLYARRRREGERLAEERAIAQQRRVAEERELLREYFEEDADVSFWTWKRRREDPEEEPEGSYFP